MGRIFLFVRKHGWLLLILLVAFILRIKGLTRQSLWLDELHTMNEADPSISWAEMFRYLKCCDPHPPLQFILARLSFGIFGHTEFTARILSVVAGTVSVYAMYLLGKALLSRRLGLIAATLTCVNYYNLFYSQEARCYIFAFLFAALSFTWFIKMMKQPGRNNMILYAAFTLCLLYSHYYSLFVLASQVLLLILFLFLESGKERKSLLKWFSFSGLIIIIGYLPWLPFLKTTAELKSFWITNIPPTFLQDFFFEYFGNAAILKPFLLLLVFLFVVRVSLHIAREKTPRHNPLVFGFVMIIAWYLTVLLVPYIRSLLVVPMLYPRYTIVALPAVLLLLAYSIELFNNTLLRSVMLVLFVVLSLGHLFFVQKYYKEVSKTQFREMTDYIVKENPSNFPVINQSTSWHQGYYLKKMNSSAAVLPGNKEALIDSVLHKTSARYDVEGFWLAGAHSDPLPAEVSLVSLDTAYVLLKQKTFYDAWARLYVSKKIRDAKYTMVRYNDFAEGEGTVLPVEKQLAVWGGTVRSKPVFLKKGKYNVTISGRGTAAKNVYPHIVVYANQNRLGDYYVTNAMEEKRLEFENKGDERVVFTIEFDNDFYVPPAEDRNLYIEYIIAELVK
jgi:4-amino-4-deoxy-L-arabinose transferase-like glycosyltransferase